MAADAGLGPGRDRARRRSAVCKILDYGKYKYENRRRKTRGSQKAEIIEVKEIKLRQASTSTITR